MVRIYGSLKLIHDILRKRGQKWMWPLWSQDFKISVYLKNQQIEQTDFLNVDTNSEKQKSYFSNFWVVMVKIGHEHSRHKIIKFSESQE